MIHPQENSVYRLEYDVPVKGIPAVNGYLILADRPVLVDGGASDDATYESFVKDLETLNLKPTDLGAVLVTHNHIDHIGLASRLARDHGTQVHVHEDEWYMVTANEEQREGFRQTLIDTFVYWGVPEFLILGMKAKILEALRFGGGISMDRVLPYPKEKFSVCGVNLHPIHCPGHTDGLVCLWWEETKSIFSNDHILPNITPNPTIYMKPREGRRCGLRDYLHSLGVVEQLPAEIIYPGHGHAFKNLPGRIGEIRRSASERREQIIAMLKDSIAPHGVSILEITTGVWKDLNPVQTFLGAREVHGFIEIFLEEGLIHEETRDRVGYFRLDRDKLRMAGTQPQLSV